MDAKAGRSRHWFLVLGLFLLFPLLARGQNAGAGTQGSDSGPNFSSTLEISLHEDGGGDFLGTAVVTLVTADGRLHRQTNTEAGRAEFDGLVSGSYTIHVTAQGFESFKQTLQVTGLHPAASIRLHRKPEDEMEQASVTGIGFSTSDALGMTTNVKEHRQLLKIAQALRDNNPKKARMDLERMYLDFSTNANLNYLFGVYEKEVKDLPKAKYYWQRAVGGDPRNLAALLELGHLELDQGKPADALPYLKRAAQVNPTSWHARALMVLAYTKLKQFPQAIEEAERALNLGHSQARAYVQPMLASALVAEGNKEQAIQILRSYLQEHPEADDARELLASLREPSEVSWPGAVVADPLASTIELAPLLPSTWMPPAVDDMIPPVEPGVPCSLDTVLKRASERMTELVQDVDRFEATESLEHQRVGKPGLPYKMETRSYRYMVSISEFRPGMLAVDEYRDAKKEQYDPPDGVVTVGLPGLALVFHPAQIGNYSFTCEGLARSKGGLTWQIHFQQRADRIPTLHAYTRADQIHPVGLKGRAWIAADTFQLVRLESDLVKAYPEIRLVAEHTQIEYGPVRFKAKDVRLWLPQKAEVYFDWRGKRVHRLLSYSNYSLFSVDSKQRISPPKNAEVVAPDSPVTPATAKPN